MSYETAPATVMIATDCACCGRALVDAKSVETGMGPHCRKKHGYDTPDAEVDFIAVAAVLASVLPEERYVTMIKGVETARAAANKIVHYIACVGLGAGAHCAPYINALAELGFTRLAGIMTDRVAAVRIERGAGTVEVVAPFSDTFNDLVRKIPTRRWVKNEGKKGGRNVFAAEQAKAVFAALVRAFPGTMARGPKGLFQLTAA